MHTIISLLRGINVGSSKTVAMDDLVSLYRSMGLNNVRTYKRSGNILFDYPLADPGKLSRMLEEHISRTVGFQVLVILRNDNDFREIIRNNPFSEGVSPDITRLHVTFLSAFPPIDAVTGVNGIKDQVDKVKVIGREVYLFCPDGYGRTKFSNTFLEKKLGVAATTRNWKTVIMLEEMAGKKSPAGSSEDEDV
ncbi:MAG TPA: DUF1697 domain-containing protein [Methanoregulaceae archaeon]|nr:DUF1697 domain-containing protein [Methanoregulaceae archaeon]